jgi:ribosomal protein S15P/S13E
MLLTRLHNRVLCQELIQIETDSHRRGQNRLTYFSLSPSCYILKLSYEVAKITVHFKRHRKYHNVPISMTRLPKKRKKLKSYLHKKVCVHPNIQKIVLLMALSKPQVSFLSMWLSILSSSCWPQGASLYFLFSLFFLNDSL